MQKSTFVSMTITSITWFDREQYRHGMTAIYYECISDIDGGVETFCESISTGDQFHSRALASTRPPLGHLRVSLFYFYCFDKKYKLCIVVIRPH